MSCRGIICIERLLTLWVSPCRKRVGREKAIAEHPLAVKKLRVSSHGEPHNGAAPAIETEDGGLVTDEPGAGATVVKVCK